MTAPAASAPKLSLHDQALINLCGWIAVQVMGDPNLDLVLDKLADTLPAANADHPLIGPLVLTAGVAARAGRARATDGHAWSTARLNLGAALAPVFFNRAALALEAAAPKPELADAAV